LEGIARGAVFGGAVASVSGISVRPGRKRSVLSE